MLFISLHDQSCVVVINDEGARPIENEIKIPWKLSLDFGMLTFWVFHKSSTVCTIKW